jgi:hypothetical protein
MKPIRIGLEASFTKKQLELYANPKFDGNQMQEICWGLQHHLTIQQASLYAKPEINHTQMREIRIGLEAGLTTDQITHLFNPEFSELNDVEKNYILDKLDRNSLNEIITDLTLLTRIPNGINTEKIVNTLNNVLNEQNEEIERNKSLNNGEQSL